MGCHGMDGGVKHQGKGRTILFTKLTCAWPSTSTYQVIVEEDQPKKLKRELGGQECFPVPLTFDDAMSRGSVHYFGAELPASSLTEAKPFTVGDNQTYSGYWNPPLEPKKAYLIYFQAMSNLKGVSGCGTRLHLVGGLGSWLDQAGAHLGSGRGCLSEKMALVLDPPPLGPCSGHIPSVLPGGSWCSRTPFWKVGIMDGCLPSFWHPQAVPIPLPVPVLGVMEPSIFQSLRYRLGPQPTPAWSMTTFLGLILGWERTIWAARAMCALLGPAADTAAAAESSWEAAEFLGCPPCLLLPALSSEL